ncbi:hypothetical protein ACQ4PT_011302 [Festuca glaucescens]
MAGARPPFSLWSLVKTGYAVLSANFLARSTGLVVACGGPGHAPHLRVTASRHDDDFFGGVISRLIALLGDLVRLRGTTVVVEVPEGHCWVEGDNTRESKDSRHYGPVPLDLLAGIATHIVWPPRRVAPVHGRILEERVRQLIDPPSSVEEAIGLSCLADSIVTHGKSVGSPRFGPEGVSSSVSTAPISDSLGSQEERVCRRECNFVYLH